MAKSATIEDALDYCLLNSEGLGADELLGRFPEHNEELAPLLLRAQSLIEVADAAPPVPAERRAAIKGRFMEAAANRQAAQQATQSVHEAVHLVPAVPAVPVVGAVPDLEPEPEYTWKPEAKERKERRVWLWPRIPRYAWASAAAVVLLMFSWWMSASSLPDSPFYDVKLSAERFIANVQLSAADHLRHNLAVAKARLDDVETLDAKQEITIAGKALDSFSENIEASSNELIIVEVGEVAGLSKELIDFTNVATSTLTTAKNKNIAILSASTSTVVSDSFETAITAATNANIIALQVLSQAEAYKNPPTPTEPVPSATSTSEPTRKPTHTNVPSPTASPNPTVPIILPDTPTVIAPSITLVPATPQASPTSGKPTVGPSATVKASPTKSERTVTVAPTVKVAPTVTPIPRTATHTHTRIPTGTITAVPKPTNTSVSAPTPTSTALVQPTNTLAPPTSTNTPIPPQPTDTREREPTNTRVPPPHTVTPVPTVPPIDTPRPTITGVRPTATYTRVPPPTPVPTAVSEGE